MPRCRHPDALASFACGPPCVQISGLFQQHTCRPPDSPAASHATVAAGCLQRLLTPAKQRQCYTTCQGSVAALPHRRRPLRRLHPPAAQRRTPPVRSWPKTYNDSFDSDNIDRNSNEYDDLNSENAHHNESTNTMTLMIMIITITTR